MLNSIKRLLAKFSATLAGVLGSLNAQGAVLILGIGRAT